MVLQLAAAKRKKKARKQANYWQCPYKSILRHHTIVSAHAYTHIFSQTIFMQLTLVLTAQMAEWYRASVS